MPQSKRHWWSVEGNEGERASRRCGKRGTAGRWRVITAEERLAAHLGT